MADNILLAMGLDTSGFRSQLKGVNADIKGASKEWSGLRRGLELGGVAATLFAFFDGVIERARAAKGEIDANTQAVRNLGDGWDYISGTAKNWGVQVVGVLGRAGENLVDMAEYAYMGADAFNASYEAIRASDAALASQRESLRKSQEHAQEFKKITADLLTLDTQRAEIALKALSTEDQYFARLVTLGNLQSDLVSYEGDALGRRQLGVKISEAQNKVTEAGLALKKEEAAVSAKVGAEDLKWYQEQAAAEAKHQQYLFDQKTTEEQITILQGRLAVLKKEVLVDTSKQTALDATDVELKKLAVVLAEAKAKAEAAALAIMEGQAEAARKTQESYEGFMNMAVLGGQSAAEISAASDAELADVRQKNNAKLQGLQDDPGSAFRFGNSLEILRLQNENARVQKELDMRNQIRTDFSFGGADAVRAGFKGDPLAVDQLIEQYTRAQDKTDKTNSLLTNLVGQLGGAGTTNSIADQLKNLNGQLAKGVPTVLFTG